MADSRWKKGQSGNPAGRKPKGQTVTDLLRQKLDADRFADALLGLAYSGDLGAIKLTLSYIDGLPTQKVEQRGQLAIVVQYAEDLLDDLPDSDDDPEPDVTPTA